MTTAPQAEPQVFVFDDLHPEDGAMLQALYSRSPASVVSHLEKVKAAGSGKFMEKFYVGYGHASIGDCGVTTIFVENYSMLCAKAIQDNQLYSGQEASTRYLDFSAQPLIDPYNTPETTAILNGWMALYRRWMPQVKDALAARYPFNPAEYKSETIWQNAVAARAFDTMRAFLPVGTTTLFSWTTNLRQARDKLMQLKHHPLPEVQTMAQSIYGTLTTKYPNSFNGAEMTEGGRYAARDAYTTATARRDAYQSLADIDAILSLTPAEHTAIRAGQLVTRTNQLNAKALNQLETEVLSTRPANVGLPKRLASYGNLTFVFALDFGSYRDVQRHRGGFHQLPLIDATLGLHPWYLSELQSLLGEHYAELETEIHALLARIAMAERTGLASDPFKTQYLYPMGMQVPVMLTYSVPQAQYVAELRSQKAVHPSLRPIAQQMGKALQAICPAMVLHLDTDLDSWTAKRGEQTITAKAA